MMDEELHSVAQVGGRIKKKSSSMTKNSTAVNECISFYSFIEWRRATTRPPHARIVPRIELWILPETKERHQRHNVSDGRY